MRTPRRLAAAGAALATLAAVGGTAGCGVLGGDDGKTLTASFDRTIGLYEKSDVRILGVRIGQVTKIVPEGDHVRVEMQYDPKYKIPADAQAVVVAPSIVSDRYVQLTPVYRGGPVLASGAVLQQDRTAVPVELDQIFSSLDKLNVALGPDGANKDGALSDLLKVSAQNLDGNGEALGSTLHDLSTAVQTLSNQRDDLFGTITNLADFTTTLAKNDTVVRTFNQDLADVAKQLAGEKDDLAQAVKQLSVALAEVSTFVKENKDSLTANVSDLASITGVLAKQKAALEEFLSTAPTALSNLQLAYNPATGTLDTRSNNTGALLAQTICSVATSPAGVQLPDATKSGLATLCANALGQLDPAVLQGLLADPSLPQQVKDVIKGLPGVGGVAGAAATAPQPVAPTGLTLSSYLGASR